jgi:hypothetical protein
MTTMAQGFSFFRAIAEFDLLWPRAQNEKNLLLKLSEADISEALLRMRKRVRNMERH